MGFARESIHHKMMDLRDSLIQIKRYIYRRICDGVFSPLPEGETSKEVLRRLAVWMQPIRSTQPTKTEMICFNSHLGKLKNTTGASPSVLFPPDNSRTKKEFFSEPFGLLKKRIFLERKFPVALLELLPGKSCKQHSRKRQPASFSQ
jgi:hypothetical protein